MLISPISPTGMAASLQRVVSKSFGWQNWVSWAMVGDGWQEVQCSFLLEAMRKTMIGLGARGFLRTDLLEPVEQGHNCHRQMFRPAGGPNDLDSIKSITSIHIYGNLSCIETSSIVPHQHVVSCHISP